MEISPSLLKVIRRTENTIIVGAISATSLGLDFPIMITTYDDKIYEFQGITETPPCYFRAAEYKEINTL